MEIKDMEIAKKLFKKYKLELPIYEKMYDYYTGKTDTKKDYPVTERSNKIVETNYIKKFITEHVAYGVGNPITYTSDSQEVIKDIDYNTQIQKTTLDSELYKNMLIFGKSYEIAYIKGDELKFKVIRPLEGIEYCEDEEIKMFLHFYKKDLDDKTYIDCYIDTGIYHFDENFEEIKDMTPLHFGVVPVSISKLDEGIFDTLYNDIKSLQDGFESILSDWINNSADLRDAYLVLTGVQLDEKDDKKSIKKKGVIEINDPSGKAEFLIKNIPSDYIRNLADTLEDKIYQISQSINSNEALQSNLSGVAILSRIINLRNRIGLEQKALKESIKNRLKLLFIFLSQLYSKEYNYRDVKINFTMNVPSDDISMAQIISQLNGKLSTETGLNQLSFIQNGRAEFEKAIAEQKELDPIINLDEV